MATFKQRLLFKLPTWQQAIPVFSTIVFVVFSWALYRMFNQVPSWLYFLNIYSVMVLTAYVLAFSLFESAIMMGLVTLLSLLFPTRTFKEHFVAQGSSLVLALATGAVLVQRRISVMYHMELWQTIFYPLAILAGLVTFIFVLGLLFQRFERLSGWIAAFADRMTIFSWIYVPLSLISLVVVLIRNIF